MRKQIILFVAPGAGKGTQAKYIVKEIGFKHLSTGDILRAEIKKESELGQKIAKVIKAGQLVDDDTILELLKSNLDFSNNQYIFDGYPRNLAQAKTLCETLLSCSETRVIYFNIDEGMLINRITKRRVCRECNTIYNIDIHAPKVEGVCDKCGGEVYQRRDDNEETIRSRMTVFKEETFPVLEFFKSKGSLVEVDASKNVDEIREIIRNIIEN
jgi:adenylate kinase